MSERQKQLDAAASKLTKAVFDAPDTIIRGGPPGKRLRAALDRIKREAEVEELIQVGIEQAKVGILLGGGMEAVHA